MKVVAAKEMARIEAQSFAEGCSDTQFMSNAGAGVAEAVKEYVAKQQRPWNVLLFCGKGNNGGDAYVAGLLLKKHGFQVRAFQLAPFAESSPLCRQHGQSFHEAGGEIIFPKKKEDFELLEEAVILDGLLGTGFHGDVEGSYAVAIEAANQSGLPIIAIDIPSGINGNNGELRGAAIKADTTLYLGLPKTGFFLGQGWNCVGSLKGVDFGLPQPYVDQAKADFNMATLQEMSHKLPPIVRNRHKYQVGYVVALAGSQNMPGAAILSSYAALRGGAGIVRLLHPEGTESVLSACHPEIIRQSYRYEETQKVLEVLNQADAVYIGPGLGREEVAQQFLAKILPHITVPVVLDADALYLAAQNPALPLPPKAILTPHWGEMSRLLNVERNEALTLEFISSCQKYLEKRKVLLVLKGGPTLILNVQQIPTVVPRGDPGMATAGSGDVLTGLIAALLAQGVQLEDAAVLGVYIHALAGEIAAQSKTSYGMVASDIIESLSEAFRTLISSIP